MLFGRKSTTATVPQQRTASVYEACMLTYGDDGETPRRDIIANHVIEHLGPVLVAKETGDEAGFHKAYVGFLDARHDIMKFFGLNADDFNGVVDYSMERMQLMQSVPEQTVAREQVAHE